MGIDAHVNACILISSPMERKSMKSIIAWFEIPVLDMNRAKVFYERLFSIEIEVEELNGSFMGFFPSKGSPPTGALVSMKGYTPSENGILLYMNGGDDLNTVLENVDEAGGRVEIPKTLITEEIGYFGIFIDTEGNRLALHSGG